MVDYATNAPSTAEPHDGQVALGAPRRRTQQERRETTIGRLIDATISVIAEVGYANASLGVICERSGVSRGGLFRHFDSRLDLMVATAAEVGKRHIAHARRQLGELRAPTILEALRLMRDRHRNVENVVWFELMVAARTDPDLRIRLSETGRQFFADIVDAARLIPGTELFPAEDLEMLVNTLEHTFDGEAIRREIAPDPVAEDRRLELAAEFAEFLIMRRFNATKPADTPSTTD
ncbi:TetR/AcrR family transcriptional regulator [Actinokineospora iranica]|uniref:DNA-binding transcriptional regulator, AcrR family n=1 Tax=Actinokineospora iranica TaxID=1271860 RepID=A0A1G6W6I0_9PSEU|nr:TetR/AcrR family transcriptional regulator [Actinokineospora iranica]SDD61451.1 DNA-binding transcriptional regulator, AcrR family [Actinokineospora iranica]